MQLACRRLRPTKSSDLVQAGPPGPVRSQDETELWAVVSVRSRVPTKTSLTGRKVWMGTCGLCLVMSWVGVSKSGGAMAAGRLKSPTLRFRGSKSE